MAPTANPTAAMTRALAASTEPRWGVAARVVRIRPRRYSPVMNIGGDHDEHDESDDDPEQQRIRGGVASGDRGHRGGDVPGAGDHDASGRQVDAARSQRRVEILRAHPDAAAVPCAGRRARQRGLMWSKVAVAQVGTPPLPFWYVTGEVTNNPTVTVARRPGRRVAPIFCQLVPLVES